MKTIKSSSLTFHYKEPTSLPSTKTVFFFALSAENSLTLPPFCNPVDTLLKEGVRVVSITLPDHQENSRPLLIQKLWAEKIDALEEFLSDLAAGVKELTNHFPPPYGAMGISRGAFIALHLTSILPEITSVVGFAPLLFLLDKERLSTFSLIPKLAEKNIHFFVGHNDTSIGTENVISLTTKIIEENESKNPNIFLKIYPSIGRNGHGTTNSIFTEGAKWMKSTL
jgi:hypothetical protein